MSNLPDYIASAKPVPLASRAAWYKTDRADVRRRHAVVRVLEQTL